MKKMKHQADNVQCKRQILSYALVVSQYTDDFDGKLNMALERPGGLLMRWLDLYTKVYSEDFNLRCYAQSDKSSGIHYGWNYAGWRPGISTWGLGWHDGREGSHGSNAKVSDIGDPNNMFVLGDTRQNIRSYFGMGAFVNVDGSFPHFSHGEFDNVLYLDGHGDSIYWNLNNINEHRSSWTRVFD